MSNRSFTALALLVTTAATACGSSAADVTDRAVGDGDASTAPAQQPSGSDTDAGGPKAEAVTGTPDNDSITEAAGVFVAPSGNDNTDGTRARPLKTFAAAITTAARVGKIVFACTGTYSEALIVSDSISIIGGLDCADPMRWKTGAVPSRIESPTSPAVTATAITSPTRLEALDIAAPDATSPGASSIGVLADHSPGLTLVGSKIAAGKGANGTDGVAAIPLVESGHPDGYDGYAFGPCATGIKGINLCLDLHYQPIDFTGASGGTSKCTGAADHDGLPGGQGGTGGVWEPSGTPAKPWKPVAGLAGAGAGALAGGGARGARGTDAPAPSELGSLTANGYLPANGSVGSEGKPGAGGAGAKGGDWQEMNAYAAGVTMGTYWHGSGGAGGGAGGCPGLPGGAGTGGGASLGVALVESPIVLDGVAISSSTGGTGGLAAFGGQALTGGRGGNKFGNPSDAGRGGDGGFAGASTNGGSGPSIGILSTGAKPVMKGTSKATHGKGGAAIDQRVDITLGAVKGTPGGIEADTKAL